MKLLVLTLTLLTIASTQASAAMNDADKFEAYYASCEARLFDASKPANENFVADTKEANDVCLTASSPNIIECATEMGIDAAAKGQNKSQAFRDALPKCEENDK